MENNNHKLNIDKLPIKLKPKLWKSALLSLLAGAIASLGVVGILEENLINDWFIALFFGFGSLIFIVNVLPGASYLMLSKEGLEIHMLFFKKSFTRWEHVDRFYVGHIGLSKMVMIRYKDNYETNKKSRSFSKALTTHEGSIPWVHGMKAEKLSEMLNQLLAAHSSGRLVPY